MSSAIDIYLRVREKEGRLYPDDIAQGLPSVPPDHPLLAEWQARSASSNRLTDYLRRLHRQLSVLELGCGNGWLSRRIAETARASVVGVDLNAVELWQAQRLNADRPELTWVIADVFCDPFQQPSFDVIVIASAIQYFEDFHRLMQALKPLLSENGEIHILDSPFYSDQQLPSARERSRKYYEDLGIPEMADHYHHHSVTSLSSLQPEWLYVAQPPKDRVNPVKDSPFPWVRLCPKKRSHVY
jgi:SAM-dependent methyltransferase